MPFTNHTMTELRTQGTVLIDMLKEDAHVADTIFQFLRTVNLDAPEGLDRTAVMADLKLWLDDYNQTCKPETLDLVWAAVEHLERLEKMPSTYAIIEGGYLIADTQNFQPDLVAALVRIAIVEFDLPPVAFTYAETCNKARADGFGGGVVVVSKNGVDIQNTATLLQRCHDEMAAQHPVSWSVKRGNLPLVKKRLAEGGDIDEADGQPLRWAALYGKQDIFEYLLDAGARIDGVRLPNIEAQYPEIHARWQAEVLRRAVRERAAPALRRARI